MSEETESVQQLTARHILVFISGCILMGIGFAFPTPVFSLFFEPIQKSFGLADAAPVMLYTTFVSIANILSALSSPAILRKGHHIAAAVAGILMGLGYIALSAMPSLPVLYIAGLIGGFCSPIVSFIHPPTLFTTLCAVASISSSCSPMTISTVADLSVSRIPRPTTEMAQISTSISLTRTLTRLLPLVPLLFPIAFLLLIISPPLFVIYLFFR